MYTIDRSLQKKLSAVRVLVLDVDGVLTDGGLIVGPSGEEYKRFHARDGHGMKMLQRSGVEIAIMTGRRSLVVTERCRELGIEHVFQGCADKSLAFEQLSATLALDAAQFAYMGDDVIDLPVMRRVGTALTVADAPHAVRQHAIWVSQFIGGNGAVREACELIMSAQGEWSGMLAEYLE